MRPGICSRFLRRAAGMALLPAMLITLTACRSPQPGRAEFLASWSPGGGRVALVSNFLADDAGDSGLWIHDLEAGTTKPIVRTGKKLICAHPQWSSDGSELLFALLIEDESSDGAESLSFDVCIVGSNGENLRAVAHSNTSGAEAFLARNAVAWGPAPGSILFQQAVEGGVTLQYLDLKTGIARPFLPEAAPWCTLEISPDRKSAAALLVDRQTDIARVYVADFPTGDWSRRGVLRIEAAGIEEFRPLIFWSPDSSRFVIPESAGRRGANGGAGFFIRLFEAREAPSLRICAAHPASDIFWNRDGAALAFAEDSPAGEAAIRRLDVNTGELTTPVPGSRNRLLSWNHEDGRLSFFRPIEEQASRRGENGVVEHRLLTCRADGRVALSLGRFHSEKDLCWSLSRSGSHAALFVDAYSVVVLNLSSGETHTISLRSE